MSFPVKSDARARRVFRTAGSVACAATFLLACSASVHAPDETSDAGGLLREDAGSGNEVEAGASRRDAKGTTPFDAGADGTAASSDDASVASDGQGPTEIQDADVDAGTADGHAFKFHPGFYIGLDSNTSVAAQLSVIDTLGPDTHVAGFQFATKWATLENPNVPGDYSGSWDSSGASGFTAVDSLVARCAKYGKHLMLAVDSSAYGGGNSTFPTGLVPKYLEGSAYGPTTGSPDAGDGRREGGAWFTNQTDLAGDYVATAVWWDPPVMARLTALAVAFAARYDTNPNFEMFTGLGESAVPAETGYTDEAGLAQLTGASGYFNVTRKAWPHTLLRWAGNYTGTTSSVESFIKAAVASDISIGGPDCTNETGTHARGFWVDEAYRGFPLGTDAGNTTDYVGKAGWVSEVQYPELGPNPPAATLPAQLGSGLLPDILAHANLQGATHMIWWIENYTGPSANRYPGAAPNLLTFIDESALTNDKYPPLFP